MGTVLLGRDPRLGRQVALKILRDDLASVPQLSRRFLEEARIGARLEHPGILPIYDLGFRADGMPFFTMRLIRGRSLAALRRERTDARTDLPRILGIFLKVSQAIAYAHAQDVIHRDLKPENVLVGDFGEVQVLDWGLARFIGPLSEAPPSGGSAAADVPPPDRPGAASAGLSIANPSKDSSLPYYRGKALLEEEVAGLGISHAIVRPTVIFSDEDILVNNIAWFLRRFPIFAIPGSGSYGLQPIFVEDMAALLHRTAMADDTTAFDAVGPEVFTFEELVRLIRGVVRSRSRIVHLPPRLALFLLRMIGRFVNDVILRREEIDGFMAGLLVSKGPPTGTTKQSAWLKDHAATVGTAYASEVARHFAPRA
jgi:serine/threonine protein kinase